MKKLTSASTQKLHELGARARRLEFNHIKSKTEVVYKPGEEAEYAWGDAIDNRFFEDGFGPVVEVKESTWTDPDSNQHRYKISQLSGQSMRICLSRRIDNNLSEDPKC
jgi:hypothetical protein